MGHEIGHITARHSAQQYSRAQVAQLGLGIGAMLGPPGRIVSGLAQIGVGMLFLGFSRENEREADDLGVEYSSRAGYDARELARFFETLERMNPGSDRSGLPGWFSTHPSPEDREGAVRRAAAEWRRKLGMSEPKIGRDAYLKHIDGLIYGENPREGYWEKDTFYHPDLQFRFPVPPGWKTKNTRTMVQMVSGKEDAAILFTASSSASPDAAAKKFVKDAGASVIDSGQKQVEGLPAHWLTSRIPTDQGVLQVRSCFILFQAKVYEFHGVAAEQRFKDYRQAFDRTMGGFGRITSRDILGVQPDRIRVRPAGSGGSVRKALSELGVPGDEVEKIALLNGMRLEDPVRPGTLFKVVERGRR
jgi:predicted Zn-dependent protease